VVDTLGSKTVINKPACSRLRTLTPRFRVPAAAAAVVAGGVCAGPAGGAAALPHAAAGALPGRHAPQPPETRARCFPPAGARRGGGGGGGAGASRARVGRCEQEAGRGCREQGRVWYLLCRLRHAQLGKRLLEARRSNGPFARGQHCRRPPPAATHRSHLQRERAPPSNSWRAARRWRRSRCVERLGREPAASKPWVRVNPLATRTCAQLRSHVGRTLVPPSAAPGRETRLQSLFPALTQGVVCVSTPLTYDDGVRFLGFRSLTDRGGLRVQLHTECDAVWADGRRMCDARSLSGRACTLRLHALPAETMPGGRATTSLAPPAPHNSSPQLLSACPCGSIQVSLPLPLPLPLSPPLQPDPIGWKGRNPIYRPLPSCGQAAPNVPRMFSGGGIGCRRRDPTLSHSRRPTQ
jgi:hypothetical protein